MTHHQLIPCFTRAPTYCTVQQTGPTDDKPPWPTVALQQTLQPPPPLLRRRRRRRLSMQAGAWWCRRCGPRGCCWPGCGTGRRPPYSSSSARTGSWRCWRRRRVVVRVCVCPRVCERYWGLDAPHAACRTPQGHIMLTRIVSHGIGQALAHLPARPWPITTPTGNGYAGEQLIDEDRVGGYALA